MKDRKSTVTTSNKHPCLIKAESSCEYVVSWIKSNRSWRSPSLNFYTNICFTDSSLSTEETAFIQPPASSLWYGHPCNANTWLGIQFSVRVKEVWRFFNRLVNQPCSSPRKIPFSPWLDAAAPEDNFPRVSNSELVTNIIIHYIKIFILSRFTDVLSKS